MKPIVAALVLGTAAATPTVIEPVHLGPDSHISVGVAVSMILFVSGLVWWLARRLQQQDDMSNGHYTELTKRLDNLPCRPNGYIVTCPMCKKPKQKPKRK